MYVSAIVLAAGQGLRFKSKVPKPLLKINSKPIIIHCLATFSRHSFIKDIILVVNPLNKKGIISSVNEHRIKKIRDIVLGGKERQDSVRNALGVLSRRTDLVLIHDGVRPCIKVSKTSL
jgi:2-C-methyl-D-erythritol 4-phosphate cytidylyltransferase